MKKLDGLRSREAFVTHLGCIKGCLEYLGPDVTMPWLYTGTGHAFIINLHETLCPSGPTAWNTSMLFTLAPNLGYEHEGVFAWKDEAGADFPLRQHEAYDLVRRSIDAGLPCYGWQLEVPDYYVISGYDDTGYYFEGYGQEKGPLDWQRLGDWDVTLLEVYSLKLRSAAPADKTLREGLAFAIKHATQSGNWVYPGYTSGPNAFDVWADALEGGRANRDGHTYNAQVWGECRAMAVEGLKEAKGRLPGQADAALDEAAGRYALVRDKLADLVTLHPPRADYDFVSPFAGPQPQAAAIAREAGAAERLALAALERIAVAL